MFRFHKKIFFLAAFLLAAVLSACGTLLTPVRTEGEAPAPVVRFEGGATEDPDVYVDLEPFQAALLGAIQSRNEALLRKLTAETFASGVWRGEMVDLPQADALRALYQDQMGDEVRLVAAPSVDLPALMGGANPLDMLDTEASVVGAVLVRGWGKDGMDEAVLFVSRQPDNALRWAGTLVIKGGFTSPETGGVQPLVNRAHGYEMYLPLGFEAQQPLGNEIMILAPQGTQGHRERAMITVEPADGRTVEQIVTELKATQLTDVAGQPGMVMNLDGEKALVFERVPSQDLQRVVFVVHEDRLYHMIFVPQDESAGEAYNQMRTLYAVVVNTFHFIPVENVEQPEFSDGKLVAEPDVFIQLLQQSLVQRDKVALQSMMGDTFFLALWRSEGIQVTPGEAIQQILNNYVPAGAQPVLNPNHAVIAGLFSEPLMTDAGEALIPVHVSGWGERGQDEAVLFIARRADGSLYWQGVLTALGGFAE